MFSGMLICRVWPIFGARGQDIPKFGFSKNCRRAVIGETDSVLSVRVGTGRLGDFFKLSVGTVVPLCEDMRGKVEVDDDVTFSDTTEVVSDGAGLTGDWSLFLVATVYMASGVSTEILLIKVFEVIGWCRVGERDGDLSREAKLRGMKSDGEGERDAWLPRLALRYSVELFVMAIAWRASLVRLRGIPPPSASGIDNNRPAALSVPKIFSSSLLSSSCVLERLLL